MLGSCELREEGGMIVSFEEKKRAKRYARILGEREMLCSFERERGQREREREMLGSFDESGETQRELYAIHFREDREWEPRELEMVGSFDGERDRQKRRDPRPFEREKTEIGNLGSIEREYRRFSPQKREREREVQAPLKREGVFDSYEKNDERQRYGVLSEEFLT
ncbi:hypothetical protein MUG91_G1988n2 [Manis pentadactyla]|nr:hypothetical protein MUG91_G1988n2 [Manis pentadactyla]